MTHTIPYESPAPSSVMHYLLHRRRLLLAGALIGLLLGIGIILVRKKTYTTSTTVLFPSAPTSKLAALGGGSGDLPSIPLLDGAIMVPQPGSSAATAVVLLESRRALMNVAGQQQLRRAWRLPDDAEMLKHFRDSLNCKVGEQGELIINFQDVDAKRSYAVTRRLLDELSMLTEELGLNPAEQGVGFLSKQVAESEERWRQAQQAMLVFQQKNHIVSLPDQAKGLADQYSGLQRESITAKLEAMAAVRQLNVVAESARQLITACTDPTVSSAGTLAPLYQRVTTVESELALLKQRFTADHPDVQAKSDELAEAKRMLQAEIERQMTLLKSGSSPAVSTAVVQAAVTQARVAGMQSALQAVQRQVDTLPQQQAGYAHLTMELEASISAVKLYREELEKARIVAERRGPLYIVADPPAQPLQADPSYRLIILLLSVLIGGCLAALVPYWEFLRGVPLAAPVALDESAVPQPPVTE